ncbi:hypothetical protein RDWZM_010050 [Blomia tropicalis]|uniref:Zinc finger PHD-type domain-containing protein n=1 Tax=Blomia tropicalis TaxID=40697 RepID=A0A9Q0LXR5_BLOTA|nr:hypothetical protein BLOT_012944 [Blomia tropicalis]KAJ6215550.1 hypothetical protein RDWZM_010050 [Blomia tropicalis]
MSNDGRAYLSYNFSVQDFAERGIKLPQIPYDYRRDPFAHGNHVFSREHRQLEPLYYRARVSAMVQPGLSSYTASKAGATVDEIAKAIKNDIADIRERHDRGERVEHVFFADEHETRAKVAKKWSETDIEPKKRSARRPWTHIKASRKAAMEEQQSIPHCYCGKRQKLPMIRCDNRKCQRKWFHLGCIRMRDVPTDVWHCQICKSNLGYARYVHWHHSRVNVNGNTGQINNPYGI